MAASIGATVYAQTVSVYIGSPTTDTAVQAGSYWVGAFPITITTGSNQQYSGEAYCLTPGGTIGIGNSYTADESAAPDTPAFDAISYILSWDTPTDGTSAAIDQVAIWELYGQYPDPNTGQYSDFYLDPTTIMAVAANLKNEVKDLNVAYPQGSTLTLSPSTSSTSPISANPSETVYFQVTLSPARTNVRIDFSATLTPPGSTLSTPLGSAYVSPTEGFTTSDGIVDQVSVTVPPDAPYGSIITLTAHTQTVWPEFLDLTQIPGQGGTQDIIGTTIDLTSSYSINVSGYIFVLPESAYGALSAIVACAAGFLIYYRAKLQTKQKA